ncbi:hypothetical protein XA68_10725 [Ophiocordyceps unilateralis]|uniref:Uncharacterized protein n=1 Tax=Ophiocordyceps unilateralis TaxID=268505 RepID=A0A2A9PP16_OPHUN|nr:hypothetical protein XA68_10725 [Ophiocordyceps unilateralis]
MAPACPSFPASKLPLMVQRDMHGQRRKPDPTVGQIKLDSCELLQMVQWHQYDVTHLKFVAVERLFRRCKDKKGTFMVETTAWENRHHLSTQAGAAKTAQPVRWFASWLDD